MAKFKSETIISDDQMHLDLQLENFIPSDDPCRMIQKLCWELDTSVIESSYSELGQGGYHPKMLLSVIFYGYSQGLRSGRKLSQACKTDIRYIYLSQGYRPGKTTFNDFRRRHYSSFEQLFSQVVRQSMKLGLLDKDEPSFGDGTKMRANASAKRSKTKVKFEQWLSHLQDDITELRAQESDDDNPGQTKKLLSKQAQANKIKGLLDQLDGQDDQQKANLTDPDAVFMKGKKGNKDIYYNPQIVVSARQFIIHNHVCTSSSDRQQLQPAMEGVKRNTGAYPQDSSWDCGYSSFDNEAFLQTNTIDAYIPDQEFGKSFEEQPFHFHHFQYCPQKDQYLCPQGKPLVFHRHKNYGGYRYRVYQGTQCQSCAFRPQCTKAKARTIHREHRQPLRDQMYYRLLTTKGRKLFAMRKYTVEPVFGHLKHNLGYQNFLLRSLDLVQAEFNIMCIAYNLMKMARALLGKANMLFLLLSTAIRTLRRPFKPFANEFLPGFNQVFYVCRIF